MYLYLQEYMHTYELHAPCMHSTAENGKEIVAVHIQKIFIVNI